MASYLVVKILDDKSFVLPSTLSLGNVELRSSSADDKCDEVAFESSAIEHGLGYEIYKVCARIATIVDCENSVEAIYAADARFLEVLDFKSAEYAISTIRTSQIGLVKDLSSGEVSPIKRSGFHPSLSFVMYSGAIQCFDATNYLLSLESELCDRYKRSLHWARNSKNETNPQLKIVFLWFALEALLKENETDNCVESYIRLFLGFPNGKQSWIISSSVKERLEEHPRYFYWQKKLIDIVQEIRNFRNDSVHSGFRSVDFTKQKLHMFDMIMVYAVSRCQSGVRQGLLSGLKTLVDFKEYAVLLFENGGDIFNDVHNNIIFSLDRADSF
ncbi:hypothetical protein ACI2KC_14805 [Pseudomonas monteilii]